MSEMYLQIVAKTCPLDNICYNYIIIDFTCGIKSDIGQYLPI